MTNTANSIPVDSFFAPVFDAFVILDALQPDQYNAKSQGAFTSSIGEHMRHILDHYQALMLGWESKYVDYNQRTRHSKVESDIQLVRACWQQVNQWLNTLTDSEQTTSIQVFTEHNLVQSTLARELSFVSSHAVHHFAFVKQLVANFNIRLPAELGVAPATIKSQQ